MRPKKTKPILYCGDDTLEQGARYLYGILKYLGFKVIYVPSKQKLKPGDLDRKYGAIILSDYPSKMINPQAEQKIINLVAKGTGLLMIGGWGSFHGYDGNYQKTKLGGVLPVQCLNSDDRVDANQGAVIVPVKQASKFKGLNFRNSPILSGYNRVKIKKGSQLLLGVKNIEINYPKIKISNKQYPLLVTGHYGAGQTACFMSDLAPHWAGGLPDWGKRKIRIKSVTDQYMEVGNKYIEFIRQIIDLIAK